MTSAVHIDVLLLKQAADWAMTFRYGTPTAAEQQAFDCWRQQSMAHEAAWARAQEVFNVFSQVPAHIGKGALRNLERGYDRRRSLRLLSALLVAAPAAWIAWRHTPWREWTADVATTTGERKTLDLPDRSRLVLNTASAVNVAFTAGERRLHLIAGEILVTTGVDTASVARPFLVDTPQGVVRALGTRFSVRRLDQHSCRVAVFEHSVEISPLAGASRMLQAGEQADFAMAGVGQPAAVDDSAALWESGMLLARDMRLGDVIDELARHRPGILRCDPAIADLRVSGALSLADTDAALAVLETNLSLRIQRATSYWISVGPRS